MNYERGLQILARYINHNNDMDTWREYSLYKTRLLDQLDTLKRHGENASSRSEIYTIVDCLEPLCLRLTNTSFVDLC